MLTLISNTTKPITPVALEPVVSTISQKAFSVGLVKDAYEKIDTASEPGTKYVVDSVNALPKKFREGQKYIDTKLPPYAEEKKRPKAPPTLTGLPMELVLFVWVLLLRTKALATKTITTIPTTISETATRKFNEFKATTYYTTITTTYSDGLVYLETSTAALNKNYLIPAKTATCDFYSTKVAPVVAQVLDSETVTNAKAFLTPYYEFGCAKCGEVAETWPVKDGIEFCKSCKTAVAKRIPVQWFSCQSTASGASA